MTERTKPGSCGIEADEEARLEGLLITGLTTGGDDIPVNRKFWKSLKKQALESVKSPKGLPDHGASRDSETEGAVKCACSLLFGLNGQGRV